MQEELGKQSYLVGIFLKGQKKLSLNLGKFSHSHYLKTMPDVHYSIDYNKNDYKIQYSHLGMKTDVVYMNI